ncbi:MAG: biotin transporter BioY [Acidimicrobiales bacterium]
MSTTISPRCSAPVLADTLPGARVRDAALVVAYAGLVGLSAQVVIHLSFTPVPITGQTFGVLLGAAALGWRRAVAGMVLYLAAGLAGVPWFAAHAGGAATLASASFGYLLGFPAAAAVTGALAARGGDRGPLRTIGTMATGDVVIYAFGMSWLMVDLHLGLAQAALAGMVPFLPGDALKILAAAALLPSSWLLVRRGCR